MLKIASFLTGAAGSIAGLLPYAPLIIAGLVVIAALGWGAVQKHDAELQRQRNTELQTSLDNANHNLGVAESAIKQDDETIKQMMANGIANDQLIQSQDEQLALADQKSSDAAAAIRALQTHDQDVQAYLRSPIPAALRSLLNNEPAASTASTVDKGSTTPTAPAK